jgi:hypothetical protein
VGERRSPLGALRILSALHEPHESRAFDLCELLRILFGFKKNEDGFVVIDAEGARTSQKGQPSGMTLPGCAPILGEPNRS